MSAPVQEAVIERNGSHVLVGAGKPLADDFVPSGGRKAVGDMKAGLTTARPDPTIIGWFSQIYTSRGMGYGADKYARGNYYGEPPSGVTEIERFLGYIAAAQRHLSKTAQAINIALGTGGDARAACAAIDDEPGKDKAGNITFPASGLPHIAHALASLMILVEVGVMDGLLPDDPGQPWTSDPEYAKVLERRGKRPAEALAQKDDPDSESRRIASLAKSSDDSALFAKDPLPAWHPDFTR